MQSNKPHNQSATLIEQMPQEIQEALKQFEEAYLGSIRSIAPTIVKATELLSRQTAKQVRPLLLLLTANCFGPITEEVINGSTFIELLHVSTLVHDDVVDDLFNDMKKEMMQAIREQNLDADRVVDYLMMAKYLEKVGDHAVNIAQWAIFRMTGDMEGVKLY